MRHPGASDCGEVCDGLLRQRIVCAIDFSASSERALAYALDVAQEADARMTLVHVIELPPAVHLDFGQWSG